MTDEIQPVKKKRGPKKGEVRNPLGITRIMIGDDNANSLWHEKEIADAIVRNRASLAATAIELQVTRRSLQKRIRSSPYLQEVLADARDAIIDTAEQKLADKVDNGYFPAIAFLLRTIGKERGWGESPQVVNVNQNANIDLEKMKNMTPEERAKLDELLSKLIPDEDS